MVSGKPGLGGECDHRRVSGVLPEGLWEGLSGILVSWVKHLVKRGTWLPVNFVNAKQRLQTIDILAPPEVFEKR